MICFGQVFAGQDVAHAEKKETSGKFRKFDGRGQFYGTAAVGSVAADPERAVFGGPAATAAPTAASAEWTRTVRAAAALSTN